MVALVRAEVIAESVNALGKQRDLYLGRTSVIRSATEVGNDTGFFFSGKRHLVFDPDLLPGFSGANSTEKAPQSLGLLEVFGHQPSRLQPALRLGLGQPQKNPSGAVKAYAPPRRRQPDLAPNGLSVPQCHDLVGRHPCLRQPA